MINVAFSSATVIARGEARRCETAQMPRVAEALVSLLDPTSAAADQYRTLRTSVDNLRKQGGLRVLAVTSPTPGDGKTVTTLNLAGVLAQAQNARVLTIDCDLRKPSVARYLGIDGRVAPGLIDALRDSTCKLADVVQDIKPFNLSVVPAGRSDPSPYELLNSPRFEELIREGRRDYDIVLLDTPPAVMLPDCRLIDRAVDGFFIVVAAHKTTRQLVTEAMNSIGHARVLAVVFNGDDRPAKRYYGYYSYYHERSRPSRTHGWWRRLGGV
jgi:capsular exopolysaccharide synthesis family protein